MKPSLFVHCSCTIETSSLIITHIKEVKEVSCTCCYAASHLKPSFFLMNITIETEKIGHPIYWKFAFSTEISEFRDFKKLSRLLGLISTFCKWIYTSKLNARVNYVYNEGPWRFIFQRNEFVVVIARANISVVSINLTLLHSLSLSRQQ